MDNGIGIYEIILNGACLYVGQSINFRDRKNSHLRKLRKGNHYNLYLQRLYNKYGKDFVFNKIEDCEKELLTKRELYWIDKKKPICNFQIPKDSTHFTIKEETRKKMSAISKSRMTKEMREKISKETRIAMARPDVRENFLKGQKNKKNKTPWNKGIKGLEAPNKKQVYCLELNKFFDSAYEAGIYVGAKNGKGVSRVCLGQRNKYKNMHWEYTNK